jgi:hypothetical protein
MWNKMINTLRNLPEPQKTIVALLIAAAGIATMHELTKVLDGDIEPVIEALRGADVEDRLGE